VSSLRMTLLLLALKRLMGTPESAIKVTHSRCHLSAMAFPARHPYPTPTIPHTTTTTRPTNMKAHPSTLRTRPHHHHYTHKT
jgi:hypothetical protein